MLESPAAERNKGPILRQLEQRLPHRGRVLEVASGTGQHVEFFAAAFPELEWQPSELERRLLRAIAARVEASGCENVAAPLELDVRSAEWPVARADALLCVNLVHIAPWEAARGLMRGAAAVLPAGAPLVLYGPFRRGGIHTAESNAAFDEALRARDPAWGVRDIEDVTALAESNGLELEAAVAMPANNMFVVYRRLCRSVAFNGRHRS